METHTSFVQLSFPMSKIVGRSMATWPFRGVTANVRHLCFNYDKCKQMVIHTFIKLVLGCHLRSPRLTDFQSYTESFHNPDQSKYGLRSVNINCWKSFICIRITGLRAFSYIHFHLNTVYFYGIRKMATREIEWFSLTIIVKSRFYLHASDCRMWQRHRDIFHLQHTDPTRDMMVWGTIS